MATNKTEQLAKAFEKGSTLTSNDIRKLGISNPTDAVFRLRKQGYCIISSKNSKGTTQYKLGTLSRQVVAYLYEQFGSSIFE